jgi:hypothetical protein
MAIREGRWDCPSCGSKAVYGRHVDCPGCGKPRPAGTRFYLTDDAPVITDAAQLAEATAGADWVCAHCGASTRATETDCTGCGAARGTSPSQPVIDYTTAQVPRSGDASAAGSIVSPSASPAASSAPAGPPYAPETPAARVASAASGAGETGSVPPAAAAGPGWRCAHCDQGNPARERRCRRCYEPRGTAPPPRAADDPPLVPPENTARKWKIGAVALAAIVTLVVLNEGQKVNGYAPNSFRPQPAVLVPATVADVRWERHVAIEARSLVQGAGFSLPDSAQVLRRERVVERYDSVVDGYRTETREVPETRVVTEYETRTRQVPEHVRVGTRTYVCGQRDLGNGYFEDRECTEPEYETRYHTETYEAPVRRTETYMRQVSDRIPLYRRFPVYGTRYHWRAPRWNVVRTDTLRGDTAAPTWPEPALTPGQRLGARGERYVVTLRRPGMPDHVFEIQPHEWGSFRAGQRLAASDYDGYGRPILFPADSLTACVRWHRGEDPRNPPPDSLGCSPLPAAGAVSAGAAAGADSLVQVPD